MSEKFCYLHKGHLATNDCERCGYPICDNCSNSYWQTNAITSMFQPKKSDEKELVLCGNCLKTTRLRNGLISGFMLLLILGMIALFIVTAI
ncbi:MAG: hypothetical protein ACTSQF_01320 [Candidatus Heimdallarchaeaceae archaeon]